MRHCLENHPANYRGFTFYKQLQQRMFPQLRIEQFEPIKKYKRDTILLGLHLTNQSTDFNPHSHTDSQ